IGKKSARRQNQILHFLRILDAIETRRGGLALAVALAWRERVEGQGARAVAVFFQLDEMDRVAAEGGEVLSTPAGEDQEGVGGDGAPRGGAVGGVADQRGARDVPADAEEEAEGDHLAGHEGPAARAGLVMAREKNHNASPEPRKCEYDGDEITE